MTSPLFKSANPRVATPYVQPVLEVCAGAGISAAQWLAECQLPPHLLGTPGLASETIAAEEYVLLLGKAAELCADPLFGLHVGEKVKLGTYNVYGLILLSCHNIGQVLQQTMRYEGLAHDLGRSHLHLHEGTAQYEWQSHFPHATRHLVESVFAGIRVFGHWLSGMPLPGKRLCFCHPRPELDASQWQEYQRILGQEPEFGAKHNLAEFDAQLLAWPVPNADVSLYPVLQQHAEQLLRNKAAQPAGLEAQVSQAIRQHLASDLGQNSVRLPHIAESLQLSPRTLQRKLGELGRNFQQILDQTRYRLACDYLRQSALSLAEIAFLLGFQEQSSFNHAFKEWSGQNPGAWRDQPANRSQSGSA